MKSNRQRLLELITDTTKPGILASPQFDELFIADIVGKEWIKDVTWQDQVEVVKKCGFAPIYLLHGVLDYSEENPALHWQQEVMEKNENSITSRYTLTTPHGKLTRLVSEYKNSVSTQVQSPLKTKEDYPAVCWYLEKICECTETISNAVKAAKNAIGDSGLLCIFCFQPFESYAMLNYDEMILRQYDYPQLHKSFENLVFDLSSHIMTVAIESGCDIIYIGSPGTETLSPQMYEDEFLQSSISYIDLIRKKGGISYYHLCGKKQELIDNGTFDRIKPDVLEAFSQPPTGNIKSLKEARKAIPKSVCSKGNIDLELLRAGTEQQVYDD